MTCADMPTLTCVICSSHPSRVFCLPQKACLCMQVKRCWCGVFIIVRVTAAPTIYFLFVFVLLPFEGGVCSYGRPAVVNRMTSCKSFVPVYLTRIQPDLVHSYNAEMFCFDTGINMGQEYQKGRVEKTQYVDGT